jgi:hypothetical protein
MSLGIGSWIGIGVLLVWFLGQAVRYIFRIYFDEKRAHTERMLEGAIKQEKGD